MRFFDRFRRRIPLPPSAPIANESPITIAAITSPLVSLPTLDAFVPDLEKVARVIPPIPEAVARATPSRISPETLHHLAEPLSDAVVRGFAPDRDAVARANHPFVDEALLAHLSQPDPLSLAETLPPRSHHH